MLATKFNQDSIAKWYAKQHMKTDLGIEAVYYLSTNAIDREIRFIEINKLMEDRTEDVFEPIEFGIDSGMDIAHKLCMVDVTPQQWTRIKKHQLRLPGDRSLDDAIPLP